MAGKASTRMCVISFRPLRHLRDPNLGLCLICVSVSLCWTQEFELDLIAEGFNPKIMDIVMKLLRVLVYYPRGLA